MPSFNKFVCAGIAGLFACGSINMPAQALTKAETMSLSYDQVKGSGFANRCPSVIGEETISLSSGRVYKVTDLCIEPKSWQVSLLDQNVCVFIDASLRTSVICVGPRRCHSKGKDRERVCEHEDDDPSDIQSRWHLRYHGG
jgi:Manganese-stabilising protein / photosystem II polypeptide